MFRSISGLAFVCLFLLSGQAYSNDPGRDPSGPWHCDWQFRRDAQQPTGEFVGGEFQMVVAPDGQVQGRGVDIFDEDRIKMTFAGAWQLNGSTFEINAQQIGGLGSGNANFVFRSSFETPSEMVLTRHYQSAQIYQTRCQRQN